MAEILPKADYDTRVHWMAMLNRYGCEAMHPFAPHSCTDITGFGFLGHTMEMAKGSGKTIEIFSADVPIIPAALQLAREGIIPSGAYRNMSYIEEDLRIDPSVPLERSDVLHDPQTSGGLLIALPEDKARKLLPILEDATGCAAIVGRVKAFDGKYVSVK